MIDYLRSVTEWVTKNKLVLNVGKNKSIVIWSRSLMRDEPALVLEIENIPVEQVYKTKRLDIIVDQHLTWSKHIDNIASKMGGGVSMVRRAFKIYATRYRQTSSKCNCSVTARLLFRNLVSMTDLSKLQVAQNEAAHCLLQCSYRANVTHMHDRLGWLTVSQKTYMSC